MRKTLWKGVLSLTVIASLILSMFMASAEFIPDPKIIQVDDPSAWTGSASMMDIVGKTMTLRYTNHATDKASAVYSKQLIHDETVEFTGRFAVGSGGWTAILLRSNLPEHYVWDMSEYYAFMIREGQIELTRAHANNEGPFGTVATSYLNMCDGKDHVIRAGAQNYGDKTYVTLSVDGESLIRYTDDTPLSVDSGYFSLSCYGKGSSIAVTAMGENEYWDNNPVQMELPKGTWTAMKKSDDWFINQTQGAIGAVAINSITDGRLNITNGKASYTGTGSITALNKLEARNFSFIASVSSSKQNAASFAEYLFVKASRTSLGGTTGYALRLYPSGRLQLMRYLNNRVQTFPAFDTGLDFTQEHKFTVSVENTGVLASEIRIWVDDQPKAYRYQDNKYGPNLQANGYFGVYNSDFNVTSTIRDLQFIGSEVYVSDSSPVEQVFWPDYLVEENGDKMIHWVYRDEYALYDGVEITDVQGKRVGYVTYPDNILVLPADHTYTQLFVTAVRADGKKAERQLVDLTADPEKYYEKNQERIIVRPADGQNKTAGFQTVSGKDFTVKGFNYAELRYGDHSTFEPAIEDVNTADYDPLKAETVFKVLSMYGYNTVRTFVVTGVRREGNKGLTGPYNSNGLYIPYMENVVDFLNRAQKYGVYVIVNFSENEMISSAYYRQMSGGTSGQGLLFSQDGMAAKADYMKLFAKYIKERKPSLLNALLAIQAQNEFCFFNTAAPFNKTSGTYTYFDGTTYDMANNDSRHELAIHALKTYYQVLRDALDEVDETLMLCEGTFTLCAVGKDPADPDCYGINPNCSSSDNRFPVTAEEYLDTALDFLDIHIYYGDPDKTAAENMEMSLENMRYDTAYCRKLRESKPVILGEYGDCRPGVTIYSDQSYKDCMDLLQSALDNGLEGGLFWTLNLMAGNMGDRDGRCQELLMENLKRFATIG